MGTKNFTLLYLLSGFGGILFSVLCDDTRSCGASTAVYGLIGSYVGYLILNWSYLATRPEKKCSVIVYLLITILIMVMFQAGSTYIDVLGHLGGFIAGAFLGLWLCPAN